jgi:pimeloyl-ACP methyl ester carboxylesterase
MTGLGERSHLLRPEVGLGVHMRDLVALMEFEDVRDAVVVAHSYGGIVVSGAMEQIAERVRSLVFLDAQMPRSGESVFDIIGPVRARAMTELAERDGEGWFIPPADPATYGISRPEDQEWAGSRISAQPLLSYEEPVGRTDRAWSHPGTYIECTPSAMEPHMLARPRERAALDDTFRYRVLAAPHDVMITDPEPLAALLLEAVDVA